VASRRETDPRRDLEARRAPGEGSDPTPRGEGVDAARLVAEDGEELGRGAPYYRYTVGQRRGLGLAAPRPLYVLAIDSEQNRVTVGPRERLLAPGLLGERLHWIGPPPAGLHRSGVEATVRIRSRHAGVPARVRASGDRAIVEFAQPQHGVAPGQAAVFYRGSRVLGGCWITEAST
jgi:tRNA-specific 2-thiouridylase